MAAGSKIVIIGLSKKNPSFNWGISVDVNKSNQNHQESESAHSKRNQPILLARVGGAHLPSNKKGDGSRSDFDEEKSQHHQNS
jgi:hypothetical protein